MYRFAWGISNGKIDCKIFLVSAHEFSFFYHCLQLRGLEKPPLLGQNNEFKAESEFKNVYAVFLELKRPLYIIKEIVKNMGVREFSDGIAKFEDLIMNKGQEPIEMYNGLNLTDVFRHLWEIVINIQTAYQKMNKKYLKKIGNFRELPQATQDFVKAIQEILLQKISTKIAVRAIQKVWKNKAKKSVAMTSTVMKSVALFKRKLKK